MTTNKFRLPEDLQVLFLNPSSRKSQRAVCKCVKFTHYSKALEIVFLETKM